MRLFAGARVRLRDGSGEGIVKEIATQTRMAKVGFLYIPSTDSDARTRWVSVINLEIYNGETFLYEEAKI